MLLRALRRLLMSSGPPRCPLVVVAGATGTGKSQLAVSLAERFNGEIINGDALQMYKGLPIATNKPSIEERRGIPHHLLGCVGLEEEPWTVQRFHEKAGSIIEEIRSREKIPVLVGGTHYYLQSLLFPKSLVNEGDAREFMTEDEENKQWPILEAESEIMLVELGRLDPEMAKSWHPRDRRKIRRSLQICLQTGRKTSDVYREQRKSISTEDADGPEDLETTEDYEPSENGDNLSDSRNRSNPTSLDILVFWTYSSPETLNERLEKRVDSMLTRGLLAEVKSMHDFRQAQAQQQGQDTIDDTRGIWIAIGCKELLSYVALSSSLTDNAEEEEQQLEKMKEEGITRMKIATTQYATRQTRWIRRKLLPAMKDAGQASNVFLLDTTDNNENNPQSSSSSSSKIDTVASEITQAFLAGDSLPAPATLSAAAKEMLLQQQQQGSEVRESRSARYCEPCGKTVMSSAAWAEHLRSKGHRRAVRPKVDWAALYPKKVKMDD